MPNRLVWEGLTEYRAELAKLPDACVGEAALLIAGEANSVTQQIKAAYPWRTGNLRKKVTVSQLRSKGRFVAGAVVKSAAPHAQIFEYGTQARHTAIGANRGSMPPGHVFVPRVVRARRRLTQLLKEMVARHGAKSVTGE